MAQLIGRVVDRRRQTLGWLVPTPGSQCTHVAVEGTRVAQMRPFSLVREAKIEAISATLPAIARWNPLRPA